MPELTAEFIGYTILKVAKAQTSKEPLEIVTLAEAATAEKENFGYQNMDI